jgi:hypothetical protein
LKPFRNEKGQTTIIVALAIVMLLGFVALTVDVGRGFFERASLQRTADMSAISGALALKGDSLAGTAATAEANHYANVNVSTFRPGQNFASTNCEQLYVNNNPGAAPAWTPPPVSCSPPHLMSGDCTNVGGVYSCPEPNPCMDKYGTQYSCVYTRPASRDFHFVFAPVIGAFSGTRILSAQSTAVSGAAAPAGATLVPWLLLDCPVLDLDGAAVVGAAQTYNPQCPAGGYAFQSQGWAGARVSLFLGSATPSGGNFQAANLQSAPCPAADQGFGTGGGASSFSAYLEAAPGSTPACATAPGARIHTQPGAAVGPLNHALDNRLGVTGGVSPATCENQTAFNNTLSDPDGDGVFAITNNPASPNPCLVALSMVVHTNPNPPWAANANNDLYHGGCCVTNLQAPDPAVRFGPLTGGTSERLLVRRFAYFYITSRGNVSGNYQVQGIFIKATDSADNGIGASPCMDSSGVCVVKIVS